MKKRKELDALVANGKVKKKQHSSSSGGASHELLQVDSETTDTEDFSVLQPKKFASKKGGFFSRLCAACVPVCTLTLVTACVVGSGTLIWMQFGMRQEVDLLRDHMRQVEEGNKGMPSEFHVIHSQLNELQKNHTALKDDVSQLNRTLDVMSKDIVALKRTADELQKSIAEAPQLENLPKEVEALSKSLADIGSKITAVETSLKQVNEQLGNNDKEKRTLPERLHVVEEKVDTLMATQQKPAEVQPAFPNLNTEIKRLEDIITETNISIWDKLIDLHENYGVIYNLTQRMNKLELSLGSSNGAVVSAVLDVINGQLPSLVNDSVVSAVDQRLQGSLPDLNEVNGTIKISTLVSYVRNLTRFYIALLAKMHALPQMQLQNLNDSLDLSFSVIIHDTAKGLVDTAVSGQDAKIQELHVAVSDLLAAYAMLKNNSNTLSGQLGLLRERVDKIQSSTSSQSNTGVDASSQTNHPPQEPNSASPSIHTSSTVQPVPSPSTKHVSDSLTPTPFQAMNATSATVVPSLNSTSGGNATAAAPHKPSHTGGSLPDADGQPVQTDTV